MRVTIRQPLHSFIGQKSQELGIDDPAEVVNFLLLQILQNTRVAQVEGIRGGVAKNVSRTVS